MYRVLYTKQALNKLRKMQSAVAKHIQSRLKEIAKDPFAKHRNVEKLINREGFRLRIGDWRVIYKVDGDTFIILVVKIKPRGDAYK